MRTLAIGNQKGGVGKTTTAVTLAHGLARGGYRVLLVDLDAQGNVADALGLEKGGGVYELLFGQTTRAVREARPGLDVVLSDHSTVEAKQRLVGMNFRERVLGGRLGDLTARPQGPHPPAPSPASLRSGRGGEGYDICILDTAPGVDILQVSALVAATHVLTPVALDHLAVVGAGDLLGSVASLQQVGAFGGRFLGVLPTMWEQSTREGTSQLQALAKGFGQLVWAPIPVDVKARECPRQGQTLWEYAPDSRAIKGAWVRHNGGEKRVGGYESAMIRLLREVGI